tara:strand:+ start:5547 stop:8330 length:2784 start_codon:yes stop_codon:yes gene_type:complete
MTHISNSTILVVGGQILTTGDFVFKARQESVDDVIDDFGPPIINFIAPVYIMEGEEREIIMSGNRTYNPLALAISGAGVTVEDVYVDNDGQITARVEVAPGASGGAGDMRDIVITTLPGQADSDGNSVEQTATFNSQLRVYFGAPALAGITYADAGSSNIVNQGDTVTATLNGAKFYDQDWDENEAMTSTLGTLAGQGLTLTGMTVDSPTQATATFTVAADAQRLSHSIKATTHSGDSNELASNLTVYYSAPTIATLTQQSGADMASIAAGETKSLRLSGSRLEGVDAANRIEVGQVDAGGNFNPSPTQEDGSGNVVLSSFATISNVSATTPAGTGANHTVDFDLAIAQGIPSDLANIGFRITALDAGGSLSTVLSLAEAFSIDAAEPTITSISVANRPAGDDRSMFEFMQEVVTITGANFYGNLTSIELAGNPTGISLGSAQKNSDTEVQVHVSIADTASLGVHNFVVTTEGGTATSANADEKLEIILPAPTLSTDPAQNNLFLDRPASGTQQHTFTIDGTNLMNIWDAGNTSDGLRATDGDFVNYYQTADTMSAALTSGGNPASGLTGFSLTATSATKATGTVTVAHNAPLGLVDLQVTTRSGATAVLGGVLDIIPADPTLATVAPDHVMEGSGDVVLTLSGANYHPAGDGAIAGSTLLAPWDLGFNQAMDPLTFTALPVGNDPVVGDARGIHVNRFANAVGGELVDASVDASGSFEIALMQADPNDIPAYNARMISYQANETPDSAWGSSLTGIKADEFILVRPKDGLAAATHTDDLTVSALGTPSPTTGGLSFWVMTANEAYVAQQETDAYMGSLFAQGLGEYVANGVANGTGISGLSHAYISTYVNFVHGYTPNYGAIVNADVQSTSAAISAMAANAIISIQAQIDTGNYSAGQATALQAVQTSLQSSIDAAAALDLDSNNW